MTDRSYALRIETAGVEAAEAGFRRIGEAGRAAGSAIAQGFGAASEGLESAAAKVPELYNKVTDAAKGAAEASSGGAAGFLKWAAAGSAVALAGVGVYEIFAKIRGEAVELAQQSLKTATDVETLQKAIYAGATQGVDRKQIVSSLTEAANKLNEVRHDGENELTKFLDANNVKYKQQNGELIQANQLLLIGADLISKAANYQDKVKAVGVLGLSEETIPLLERGRAGIQALMDEAQGAGAVRSKELIAADAEVARRWNETTTRWAITLKGAVLDVADYIKDHLGKAAEDALDRSRGNNLNRRLEQLGDPATKKAIRDNEYVHDLLRIAGFDLSHLDDAPEPEEGMQSVIARTARRDRERVDEQNRRADLRRSLTGVPGAGDGTLKFPEKDDPEKSDFFTRSQDTVRKRTAEYVAEAGAVGQNTEAKVRAKAVADQLAAADRAKIVLTDEQRKSVLDLAVAEGRAAQSAKDAEQRWQGLTSAVQFGGNELISVLDKVGERGTRLGNVFQAVGNAIRHALLQAGLLGQGPLAGFLGLASRAGTNAPGGVLGMGLQNLAVDPFPAFGEGGIMTRYGALPLHRYDGGGIADRPQLALFGERGKTRPEAYVPLPDGRSIPVSLSAPSGGAAPAAAAPNVSLQVHNYAGVQVEHQATRNQGGGMDLHLTVRNTVRGVMADDVMRGGPIARALEQRYGLDRTRGLS